jgi:hypothetical protein
MIIIERDFDKTDKIKEFAHWNANSLIAEETNKLIRWLNANVGKYIKKRSRHKQDYGNEHTWLIEAWNAQNELGGEYNNVYGFNFTKEPSSIYYYTGKGWKYYVMIYHSDYQFEREYRSYLRFDNDTHAVQYKLGFKTW